MPHLRREPPCTWADSLDHTNDLSDCTPKFAPTLHVGNLMGQDKLQFCPREFRFDPDRHADLWPKDAKYRWHFSPRDFPNHRTTPNTPQTRTTLSTNDIVDSLATRFPSDRNQSTESPNERIRRTSPVAIARCYRRRSRPSNFVRNWQPTHSLAQQVSCVPRRPLVSRDSARRRHTDSLLPSHPHWLLPKHLPT